MKRFSIIALFLSLGLFFTGCEENKNPIFDSVNGQTMSQFVGSAANQAVISDGTAYTDITVYVTTASTSDRTIDVVAGANTTASANQYTISNLVIPAGAYEGTVRVAGNYATLPINNSSVILELNLTGIAGSGVVQNGTYTVSMFRFCPIPAGDYVIDMDDSWGDGWQTDDPNGGSGMTATIVTASGTTVVEFGMCSDYTTSTFLSGTDCNSTSTAIVSVPAGATDLIWNFPGDWYGEISYTITAPGGQVLSSVTTGGGTAGVIPVSYCF